MHVDPPPIFARDLRFVPASPMLFYAFRKIAGGLIGRTGFIYQIISCWAAILWEGKMFHDLSEVSLGLDI